MEGGSLPDHQPFRGLSERCSYMEDPIRQVRIACEVLRASLPADAILAYDVGAHTHQIATQWRTDRPLSCLSTNGWSSMGTGTVHGKSRPASQRVTAMEAVTGPSTRRLVAILMTRPAVGSA